VLEKKAMLHNCKVKKAIYAFELEKCELSITKDKDNFIFVITKNIDDDAL
jgi:hypothetical protein